MFNFFLVDFSPIRPEFGTLFWTLLIFLIVWIGLGSVAFKPIQKALRKRDNEIQDSIDEAKRVQAQMAQLKDDNQRLLAEAREESTRIVSEAEAFAKDRNLAVLDLTADSNAPKAFREEASYHNLPLLDLVKPSEKSIEQAVKIIDSELKSGRKIYIHCQLGLQRSARISAAWLLKSGKFNSSGEAECFLQTSNPSVLL